MLKGVGDGTLWKKIYNMSLEISPDVGGLSRRFGIATASIVKGVVFTVVP
jgi:hypothetical protein